jgi:uncharacterized protein YsxB (DUF464 family)
VIRVVAVRDEFDREGGLVLYVTGHADTMVCAGASALWHTMLAGLEMIAKRYPKEMVFQSVVKEKPKKKPVKKKARRRRS